MQERTKRRLSSLTRVAFLIAGLTVLYLLVRSVGLDALSTAMRPTLPWLPVLLALDAIRIGCDTTATYFAYGELGRNVPRGPLVRAHVIANAVTMLAPAGRTAAEATKAALLAKWVGWPQATAAATLMQSLALIAGAVVSIPCALAALSLTGGSVLTFAITGQGLGVLVMGLGLRLATRNERIGKIFARRSGKLGTATVQFQDATRGRALVPLPSLAALTLGRACQVTQYWVLVNAIGGATTLAHVLVAQGVNMVGLAVGVLVPGQVGATDSAFAMSSEALALTQAQALGVAMLIHVLQVIGIIVGTLTPVLWPVRLEPPAKP